MSQTGAILARMKSIRQTVQISSAQKLIAASRIGKARRLLSECEPYHERISKAIAAIMASCPEVSHKYLAGIEVRNRRGLLVVSANAGLAGGYNSNLIKITEESMEQDPPAHLIVLGQVGMNHFLAKGITPETVTNLYLEPPTLFAAREVAEYVAKQFDSGEIDYFDIAYTHFHSAVRLTPVISNVLPLRPEMFDESDRLSNASFEPDPEEVLEMLIPKYLKGFIYGCLVHAHACELASRMTAMDSAIRNGRDMLGKLSLSYNRMRQAAITQEITEIVAGAAAMTQE